MCATFRRVSSSHLRLLLPRARTSAAYSHSMGAIRSSGLSAIAKRWLSVSLHLVNTAVQMLACSLPDPISEARLRLLRDHLKDEEFRKLFR